MITYQMKVVIANEKEIEAIGRQAIECFGLKEDKKYLGRYKTNWGSKTPLGIGHMVFHLIKNKEQYV